MDTGDGLDYLLFLLLDKGLPAGELEEIVGRASSASARSYFMETSKNHWLVTKARELAWRIRVPGLLRTDGVTLRRLDDALRGLTSTSKEVISDGLRAVQSLDDLGTPEANRLALAWMKELQAKLGSKP